METPAKHFKFINSKTGNAIHYCTINPVSDANQLKAELEKIRDQVASANGVFMETVYWEEITDKD